VPLYPAGWIIRKDDPDFIVVYTMGRKKYGTFRLILGVFFFSVMLPFLYAHTLMPYPCEQEEVMEIAKDIKRMTDLTKVGCDFEDWMRSGKSCLLGCAALVLTFVVGMAVYFSSSKSGFWDVFYQRAVGYVGPQFLPRVLYNGLGRYGSRHSAEVIFEENEASEHYSWMHDLLGSQDYVMILILLAMSMSLSILYVSYQGRGGEAGVRGLPIGALASVGIVRIQFLVMDFFLGATDDFICKVQGQLGMTQPQRTFLDVTKYPPVLRAAEVFQTMKEQVERSARRYDDMTDDDAKDIAAKMRENGVEVIMRLIRYIQDFHFNAGVSSECCLKLAQSTGGTFATSRFALTTLALMDVNAVICAYFDPIKVRTFPSSKFLLDKIYVEVPAGYNICCEHHHASESFWKVQDVSHMRELLNQHLVDNNAEKRGHGALSQAV
jgi:hypothetical protein